MVAKVSDWHALSSGKHSIVFESVRAVLVAAVSWVGIFYFHNEVNFIK